MDDYPFEQTVRELKQIRNDVPVIGISPHPNRDKTGADYMISSHDPHAFFNFLPSVLKHQFRMSGIAKARLRPTHLA
jgi:hypothetical protein